MDYLKKSVKIGIGTDKGYPVYWGDGFSHHIIPEDLKKSYSQGIFNKPPNQLIALNDR